MKDRLLGSIARHPIAQRRTGGTIAFGLAFLLAAIVGFAAAAGTLRPLEQQFQSAAFMLSSQQASAQVQVVEMDAASMAAIRRWPWPRDHYARVVSHLDAAGARSISFDVDFSSDATPDGDRAFAEALAQASIPVTLPTFAQQSGFREGRQLDSLPIPALREHAQLASVAVLPDPDGFVRQMPFGTVTDVQARPSLAAFIAGRNGSVAESFPIDFSIDMTAIPRHSFIAIERGEFDPATVKGKDIIIGATAIELGDRYPVPRYGVIPGVIIQAIAAETLLDGVPQYGSFLMPLALALIIAAVTLAAHKHAQALCLFGAGVGILIAVSFASFEFARILFEVIPALLLLMLATALRLVWLTYRAIEQRRKLDAESGLPNLAAFDEYMITAAATGYVVAAKIDNFEALQAAFGRDHIGTLLRRIVERLEVTTSSAAIFRLEDRILGWHTNIGISEIESTLAGMTALMRSPIEVAGQKLVPALTFGVALVEDRAAVANAAHAASQARKSGVVWRLHVQDEDKMLVEQFTLLGEIEDAMHEREIILYYQPKLNLATGRIDTAEALVRWQHPTRGLLTPNCFIPLAEESGRIEDLTLTIIQQTIADLKSWCEQGIVMGAAVNISAGLLTSPSFTARALHMLADQGPPAGRLTFEVTETADLENAVAAVETLNRFRAHGVRISVDDYGTGQSTLSYLKLLPLSELKIDRSFVQNAHLDPSDGLLVKSTIHLAHELGLKVVAEGIEDADCLAFIKKVGCDYAQGYFIGRPMPAAQLSEVVRQEGLLAA